ncbi:MAG: sensor histidine kinase [Gammaproteobacteria bacterium]|jgi:signal transduction histidine kinase
MKSIQTRLATGLLVSLIILLVIQWVVIATSIQRISDQYIASRLMRTADTLVAALTFSPATEPTLDRRRIDPVFSKVFSGYYYAMRFNAKTLRSRSLWDETLPFMATQAGDFQTRHANGPQDQDLLLVSGTYRKQGNTIDVTVAEDVTVITRQIDNLLMAHAGISLFILIILVSVQVYIIKRSLRPLDATRDDLAKLEHGLIDNLNEQVPREIHALVHEINVRVTAFRQRLERSRRATGNLAHALKAPLTLLWQLIDDPSIQQKPGLRDELQQHIKTIQQIIDRELKRARLAGTVVGTRQTELKPEITALVKSLESMYRDKNLDLKLTIPDDCRCNMDREDFHEMMGNILDNACKWAEHRINIQVNCTQGLVITVEDDGPGIPEAQLETIINRGQRLDEHTAGHGLGLSIVKDIIDQYAGTISMSPSETLNGLRTNITIPHSSGTL